MAAPEKETILTWIRERLEDIEQDGKLSAIGLLHIDGHGRENVVHDMKSEARDWGDAEKMGEVFFARADRHAKGLPGAQQFVMHAMYGTSGKVMRMLPFNLAGKLAFGDIPGGGMATEPPTPVGQLQQGMRMGELVVQGMLGQINPTFRVLSDLIDRLMRRQAELEGENRELFIALRQELERSVQLAHEQRMKQLEFIRTTDERRRIIKIMPALLNAMTGREVFPTSAEDTAIIETLCENVSEDEVKLLTTTLGSKSPELAGLIMNRFNAIQKRKADESSELNRLAREATGGYEAGERDAAGQTLRIPRAGEPGSPENPRIEKLDPAIVDAAAKPKAIPATATAASNEPAEIAEDTKLLDDLMEMVEPAHVQMLAMTLGQANPELAKRIAERLSRKG